MFEGEKRGQDEMRVTGRSPSHSARGGGGGNNW